jgi:hypothetical protein
METVNYKKTYNMKKIERRYIDSYDGREGCLATIAVLAALGASLIVGLIFASGCILICELIKSIK